MGNFTSTSGAAFTPSDAFFLVEATRSGSLDVVRLFLKKNPALVYATDANDASTPWHVAASAGHDVVLRVLTDTTRAHALSNNFDPLSKAINKQNSKGQTPLMLACGGGHSVCVRLLLESGAHLLVADTAGRSALHYAALHSGGDGKGNDCAELLLAHLQQQLIAQGPVVAPPAVHANVIRKFADSGDMYSRTALHCAAWSGNTRAVHALWAVGADICARSAPDCYDSDLPCNSGTTPLHFAAMRGHQPVVVLLLAAWHRMVTRPSAPLPRGPFSRLPPPSLQKQQQQQHQEQLQQRGQQLEQEEQQSDIDRDVQQREGGCGRVRLPSREGCEAEGHTWQQPQQELSEKPVAGGRPAEAEGGAGLFLSSRSPRDEDRARKEGDEAEAEAEAGKSPSEGQRDGRQAEEGRLPSSAGTAAAGPGAGVGSSEAALTSAPATAQSSDGGASGSSESGSASSSAGGSSQGVGPPAQLALLPLRPPSPRPPLVDPRLMVDAYGMTPYSVACKRSQDRSSGMLIELLDPSTDFRAGDESSNEEDGISDGRDHDGVSTNGTNGVDTEAEAAELLRRGSRGQGRLQDGDDSDNDDDSEAGAAGPLLLYEGVELIQSIAADPERFFQLQQTETLLQPQLTDDSRLGQQISTISTVARRSGNSCGDSQRATGSTTDVVPDCFLCPLTCQVFRDPVVAADGVTYEREAIERHLRLVPTSPLTKQRLPSKHVYPNAALKAAIEHWRAVGLAPRPSSRGTS